MSLDEHGPTPRGRTFVWAGIGLGVLLIVILVTKGFGLFSGPGEANEQPLLVHEGDKIVIPAGSPLRSRLIVITARDEETNARLSLPAMVESDPARTAAVLSPLGGRVVKISVALGDRVVRGQTLAVIDSPDLAQAYDDNDKAADTFKLTQKNLKRQEEQFKIGAASAKDLDQARSDYAQAEAEYARTQARLNMLGAPAGASRNGRLLSVRAPLDGSVTTLSIATGNMINDPTQPIMTVADLSTIWVTALVPEKDIAEVGKNEEAEVRLEAYPGRVLRGKVLFVSDVVEPDTRRDKIRIAFANPDYALKPNMFATVTLAGQRQMRIVVPTSALLMNNDRTSVFVAVVPWTFERRTVESELGEGQSVVISSGLNPGDRVVVKGGILLND
jgi:cobalt-zinc-cadmium efflux system membrane fusion protein